MRELLCNFFYLFINTYICYFFWRGPWLVATQLLRDEIEKSQKTFLFVTFKNLFIRISFLLSNKFFFLVRHIFVKEVLKYPSSKQSENYLLFSFLHFYTLWFFFLLLLWFFLSYLFEIMLIYIPMW